MKFSSTNTKKELELRNTSLGGYGLFCGCSYLLFG